MDNVKRLILSNKNLLVTLLLALLLSSCTHMVRKDGPPNFYVDVSHIPNAVPKVEARSKYGNPPSYSVFGHRYYPMHSSRNYQAVGIASWYGTKFHKLRTSSGEPYNMLAMTAAHKTLPLPTYVEVTNLKNHRHILVKVNDRGPFEGNRLIDLSYVAARKLGMAGRGTAIVKIKAIDPHQYGRMVALAENQKKKIASHTEENTSSQNTNINPYQSFWITQNSVRVDEPLSKVEHYSPIKVAQLSHRVKRQPIYLQVGAFHNKSFAEKLKSRLITVAISAPVNIKPSHKTKLYHVRIGPINDVATANRITHQLKRLGIKSNKV